MSKDRPDAPRRNASSSSSSPPPGDAEQEDEEARASIAAPAEPSPVVFIIGAGVVGTTLAARLSRAGVPVAGLHGRQSALSEVGSALAGVLGSSGELPQILRDSDVVIISVRDARIPEIAQRLVDEKRVRPDQVVLHTSGNRPAAEMLAAAKPHVRGVGTLHPLIAVTDAPGTLENLKGAYFGIEGDDEAKRLARWMVQRMGGRPLDLAAESMALYHAAAVLASNYVVALADIARAMLVAAGVRDADALPSLLPLMTSAVRNMVEVGLPSAMTGPVVRGDVPSIERHIAALTTRAPEVLDLYRRLGREVLRIARKRVPDLDDRAVERMGALFDGEDETEERGERTVVGRHAPGTARETESKAAAAAKKPKPKR
jgi:predicted short-subunit dehydrogenase-like oxidoreductase (DUF2520 family)